MRVSIKVASRVRHDDLVFNMDPTATLSSVRSKIASELGDISIASIKLIFAGRILSKEAEDGKNITEVFGENESAVLHACVTAPSVSESAPSEEDPDGEDDLQPPFDMPFNVFRSGQEVGPFPHGAEGHPFAGLPPQIFQDILRSEMHHEHPFGITPIIFSQPMPHGHLRHIRPSEDDTIFISGPQEDDPSPSVPPDSQERPDDLPEEEGQEDDQAGETNTTEPRPRPQVSGPPYHSRARRARRVPRWHVGRRVRDLPSMPSLAMLMDRHRHAADTASAAPEHVRHRVRRTIWRPSGDTRRLSARRTRRERVRSRAEQRAVLLPRRSSRRSVQPQEIRQCARSVREVIRSAWRLPVPYQLPPNSMRQLEEQLAEAMTRASMVLYHDSAHPTEQQNPNFYTMLEQLAQSITSYLDLARSRHQ
eukprot:gnl/Dysnectes_brevis/785_a865_1058.p1 GENE.gnl/Dysnectes_brevis/785_a865_1058~~gnl/Dysnectes_brevis/785_a865_1058.p1  ORF type:complete len:421 (+),score=107.72 gnl/Dysnectes_brevis/785_a865_1058:353-1615(+)